MTRTGGPGIRAGTTANAGFERGAELGRKSRKKEDRRNQQEASQQVYGGIVAFAVSLHNEAVELAVESSACSASLYRTASNDIVRDALFTLLHDATIVHRSVGTLVLSGWASSAAILVRTVLDISASAAAILRGKVPALNAFRYFYAGMRRLSRDERHPSDQRKRLRAQMRARVESLPVELKSAAVAALNEKDRKYWFSPEWSGPKEVLQAASIEGIAEIYQQLSASAHGGFMGFRLFHDNPDSWGINPRLPLGEKSLVVLTMSSRFLVELVSMRNDYEHLGLEPKCQQLRDQLCTLQKVIRRYFTGATAGTI